MTLDRKAKLILLLYIAAVLTVTLVVQVFAVKNILP